VELVHVLPLISNDEVILKLEFRNNSSDPEDVQIELEGLSSMQETLAPKTNSIFSIKLPGHITEVNLRVRGPGLDESQTILLQETIPLDPGIQDVSNQMNELTAETEDYIKQLTGVDLQGNLIRATLALIALVVVFAAFKFWRQPSPSKPCK
jgi:hypothetical protein